MQNLYRVVHVSNATRVPFQVLATIQSLQDFGFTPDGEAEERQGNAEPMPEDDPQPARGGGASSATAYRNINRQLSTFYEPPAADEEKEELKRQVAELTERLQR